MVQLYPPEISQWGTGANHRVKDCGIACAAMVLALYGKLNGLTVDQLDQETPLAWSDSGLWPVNLLPIFIKRGIGARVVQPVTLDAIRAELDAHRPVIALVAYRYLLYRLDQADRIPGDDGHFILLDGYSGDTFTANDPDYWAPYVERGHNVKIFINQFEEALLPYGSACIFLEVSLLDQLAGLLNEAQTIVKQLQDQAANPPAPAPTPAPLIIAVRPKLDGTHVRGMPTIKGTLLGTIPATFDLNVTDAKVNADGHDWYKIVDGEFAGDYIAQDTVAPKV